MLCNVQFLDGSYIKYQLLLIIDVTIWPSQMELILFVVSLIQLLAMPHFDYYWIVPALFQGIMQASWPPLDTHTNPNNGISDKQSNYWCISSSLLHVKSFYNLEANTLCSFKKIGIWFKNLQIHFSKLVNYSTH